MLNHNWQCGRFARANAAKSNTCYQGWSIRRQKPSGRYKCLSFNMKLYPVNCKTRFTLILHHRHATWKYRSNSIRFKQKCIFIVQKTTQNIFRVFAALFVSPSTFHLSYSIQLQLSTNWICIILMMQVRQWSSGDTMCDIVMYIVSGNLLLPPSCTDTQVKHSTPIGGHCVPS